MSGIIEQASSFAADIDFLIILVAILGGIFFFAAEFLLFYFVIKFRQSKNPKGKYLTGETHQEKKFIHWPHNLVILCDLVIIFFAIKVWYEVKQELPPADETIRITAQQWAWKFETPGPDGKLGTADDVKTVDELHLENGKTYHFKLRSDDVLHSFSVPVFRLKQDMIPGREITGWFKTTKTGEFDIQCAEMCGIGHGIMGARLYVRSPENHAKWMNQNHPVKISQR